MTTINYSTLNDLGNQLKALRKRIARLGEWVNMTRKTVRELGEEDIRLIQALDDSASDNVKMLRVQDSSALLSQLEEQMRNLQLAYDLTEEAWGLILGTTDDSTPAKVEALIERATKLTNDVARVASGRTVPEPSDSPAPKPDKPKDTKDDEPVDPKPEPAPQSGKDKEADEPRSDLAAILTKLEENQAKCDARFDDITQRVSGFDQRITQIEERLNGATLTERDRQSLDIIGVYSPEQFSRFLAFMAQMEQRGITVERFGDMMEYLEHLLGRFNGWTARMGGFDRPRRDRQEPVRDSDAPSQN